MKLSIVLSTQPASFSALAYKGELEKNIAKIADLGYDGVELAVRDPALLNVDHIGELLVRHKLTVPAIGTGQAFGEEGLSFTDPDPQVRKQAIARIKGQISFARELRASIILGLIRGRADGALAPQQARTWLTVAIRDCAEFAEQNDVRLALEPINRYETNLINNVQQGLDLTSEINSPSFGLLLDTFHMNIEEPAIGASIRMAGSRIFHFHVADSNRWYPGAGHLNFESILKTLNDTGYDGFVSAEILPEPDGDTCAEKTAQFMRPLLCSL